MAMKELPHNINRYDGVWTDMHLPSDADDFHEALSYSLQQWGARGLKVVWLTISAEQSSLMPTAIACGFSFHHVRDDAVILTKRLVPATMVPDFAHHTMGVGGIVINEHHQVLTIIERYDKQERPGHWKFPGGHIDTHELIETAVVREVFEETGVNAAFNHVVGMGHHHRGQFGTSSMYILCRLQALTDEIVMCPNEIADARWFNIDEYLCSETVTAFNKACLRSALQKKGLVAHAVGQVGASAEGEYELFL